MCAIFKFVISVIFLIDLNLFIGSSANEILTLFFLNKFKKNKDVYFGSILIFAI